MVGLSPQENEPAKAIATGHCDDREVNQAAAMAGSPTAPRNAGNFQKFVTKLEKQDPASKKQAPRVSGSLEENAASLDLPAGTACSGPANHFARPES